MQTDLKQMNQQQQEEVHNNRLLKTTFKDPQLRVKSSLREKRKILLSPSHLGHAVQIRAGIMV